MGKTFLVIINLIKILSVLILMPRNWKKETVESSNEKNTNNFLVGYFLFCGVGRKTEQTLPTLIILDCLLLIFTELFATIVASYHYC